MSITEDGYDLNLLETCNLRIRLADTLERHGFKYLTDLEFLTDQQILSLQGVGKIGLAQIRHEINVVNMLKAKDNAQ
ncbi:MAG: hypothetical protein AAAB13_20470 [Pseudomonas sp.]